MDQDDVINAKSWVVKTMGTNSMKHIYGVSNLFLAMVFLSSCVTPSEPAQTKSAKASANSEQEIRQFIKDWEQAGFNGNRAWFERHYADSFVKTDQTGQVVDKKNQVDGIALDPFRKIETSAVDDLKIQMFGDVAVATFKVTIRGKTKTGPYNVNARATSVFVKREGFWQIVAHHATDIASAK